MFNDKDKAELLLSGGVEATSLMRSIFLLSKYYKYLGVPESEAIENIDKWLETQKHNYSYNKIIGKKYHTINTVYSKDYMFNDDISAKIYLEEMKIINKLKTRGEKKIAFCLLYLSKVLYIYEEDGGFCCSYDILVKLSGMQERQITDIVTKLESSEIITFIHRNRMRWVLHYRDKSNKERDRVYKHPNKYKINFPKGRKLIETIGDVDCLESSFVRLYKICIEKHKFKVSQRFKKYINKHIFEEDIINGFEVK